MQHPLLPKLQGSVMLFKTLSQAAVQCSPPKALPLCGCVSRWSSCRFWLNAGSLQEQCGGSVWLVAGAPEPSPTLQPLMHHTCQHLKLLCFVLDNAEITALDTHRVRLPVCKDVRLKGAVFFVFCRPTFVDFRFQTGRPYFRSAVGNVYKPKCGPAKQVGGCNGDISLISTDLRPHAYSCCSCNLTVGFRREADSLQGQAVRLRLQQP